MLSTTRKFITRYRNRNGSVNGFTIVEILIVLTVAGILVAILLPVSNQVRNTSYRTTCQSNLKQIGMAIHAYTVDNNRRFPVPYSYNLNPQSKCIWVDRIAPYVKTLQIFSCPAHPAGEFRSSCTSPAIGDDGYAHYSNGSYLINDPPTSRPHMSLHEVRIRYPTTTILIIDAQDGNRAGVSDGYTAPGADPQFDSMEDFAVKGIPNRHNGGNNTLFFDGHVKWLKLEALTRRGLWRTDGRDDRPTSP